MVQGAETLKASSQTKDHEIQFLERIPHSPSETIIQIGANPGLVRLIDPANINLDGASEDVKEKRRKNG